MWVLEGDAPGGLAFSLSLRWREQESDEDNLHGLPHHSIKIGKFVDIVECRWSRYVRLEDLFLQSPQHRWVSEQVGENQRRRRRRRFRSRVDGGDRQRHHIFRLDDVRRVLARGQISPHEIVSRREFLTALALLHTLDGQPGEG